MDNARQFTRFIFVVKDKCCVRQETLCLAVGAEMGSLRTTVYADCINIVELRKELPIDPGRPSPVAWVLSY